jgi:hypothetical protein
MLHVLAACPCCMSTLHFHAAYPSSTSLLHVKSACQCCKPILLLNAACPCSCPSKVSVLRVHDVWPCRMPIFMLQVLAACPRFVTVLHAHVNAAYACSISCLCWMSKLNAMSLLLSMLHVFEVETYMSMLHVAPTGPYCMSKLFSSKLLSNIPNM